MGDPDSAATARGWWPHVRGALLLAHIVAIVLMSLPNVGKIADRARWREHRTQYEIRAAAAKARRWGLFDGSDGEFEAWLWQLAQRYVAARAIIDRPLGPYGYYCGTQQAWGMFKAPARKAESIRLEIETPSGRTLLFRNGSSHDYLSRQMSNNRFRKITGRLGRRTDLFEAMADWMAAAALRDHPEARAAVVVLEERDVVPASALRDGDGPELRDVRRFELRRDALDGGAK